MRANITLSIDPGILLTINEIAYRRRLSRSKLVSEIFEQYINENGITVTHVVEVGEDN